MQNLSKHFIWNLCVEWTLKFTVYNMTFGILTRFFSKHEMPVKIYHVSETLIYCLITTC